MVPPGFSQGMGAEVSPKPDLMADRGHKLPGLPPRERLNIPLMLRRKEDEVVRVVWNIRIGGEDDTRWIIGQRVILQRQCFLELA